MARHLKSSTWPFFHKNKQCDEGQVRNGYVQTFSAHELSIVLIMGDGTTRHIILHRNDARMMAKRIEQCLERTK